jgi:uncharacterized coiled-coil DUF342 family protein
MWWQEGSIMIDVSGLSEGEIKKKVNVLRQHIDHKEREIKNHYHEINLHNKGAKDLRVKRDELHEQAKALRDSVSVYRQRRDEVNKKIAELKQQREEVRGLRSGYAEKIGELKTLRDSLNNIARGRLESLNNAYLSELEKFTSADISLEYEQSLFKRLRELRERLQALYKANEIHSEIGEIFGKVGEFHQDLDAVNALIQDMAAESQQNHEAMRNIYNEIDEIRSRADEYHKRLVGIYEVTRPMKEKIDTAKKSVSEARAELEIYLDRMKDIQLSRDEKKQEEKHEAAKEKFNKSGRLSLEDLRVLMENDEIKFEN